MADPFTIGTCKCDDCLGPAVAGAAVPAAVVVLVAPAGATVGVQEKLRWQKQKRKFSTK